MNIDDLKGLLLYFGFSIGLGVGIVKSSWGWFFFIFLGPVILFYIIEKVVKNYNQSLLKIKEDKTINTIKRELKQIKTKITKFKKSKHNNLLKKFVKNLDYEMSQELTWLAYKNAIYNDDYEFLKFRELINSNKKITFFGFEEAYNKYYEIAYEFISLKETIKENYSELNKLEIEKLYIDEIEKSNIFDYNPKYFDKLKDLLKFKGFKFTEGELVYLIILEKGVFANTNFNKYLSKNANTLDGYILNFISYNYEYDNVDIEKLILFLKKNKITIKKEELIEKIENIREKQELKNFENKINESNFINISDIDKMSGYDFESFLVKLYKKMGYSVQQTPLSNDQGGDLVVEKLGVRYVVQAKRYNTSISNSAVQQVVASIKYYNADKGILITNSIFTKSSINLADSNKIELIDRDELKYLIRKYF